MSWNFANSSDVPNMCNKNSPNGQELKTDLNMSFYENAEETTNDNASGDYGVVSRSTLFSKKLVCTSLDSGYSTNPNFDDEKTSLDMEDFVDLADDISQPSNLPTDFSSLLNDTVVQTPSHSNPLGQFKRHLSEDFTMTPSHVEQRALKKLKTPETVEEPIKYNDNLYFKLNLESPSKGNLIGDYTQVYSLPVICGRHPDLNSITPTTLVKLIIGSFIDKVSSFEIIDCRYPYEFEGGHIKGAINLFTGEQIEEKLMGKENLKKSGQILVFHCEFSSERAPNLCRALRKLDRHVNQQSYPALHYPEIYLLEGGYKQFYTEYAGLCVPQSYLPMRDSKHQQELFYFRSYCKGRNTTNSRPCLGKRLSF